MSSHSIDFVIDKIKLALELKGIISYLSVWKQTQLEIDECITLKANTETVEWEPYSENFECNESTFELSKTKSVINKSLHYLVLNDHETSDAIAMNSNCSSLTTKEKQLYVSSDELARNGLWAQIYLKPLLKRLLKDSWGPKWAQ